ncbi:MAG: phage tail protein, partial [Morganella sp. (in: enterobacteria)]
MSVMNKPDYKIFAKDAKSGELVTFPDILRGWGITLEQYNGFPPMELFNSAAKRIDEWLMYLTQRGLPEWDASVDYPKDALIQHAGVYYVALKVSKGEQPNNSQTSWKKMSDFLGVDGKLTKNENGADIPNKPKFIENLGLGEAAKSGLVQTTGTSTTNVMSQKSVTDELNKKFDKTGGK